MKALLVVICFQLSFLTFGQLEGIFIANLERTLSDSTKLICIQETGAYFETENSRIVFKKDNQKAVQYEYFNNGKRISYFKENRLYLEKTFIDSSKFYHLTIPLLDSKRNKNAYEDYVRVYRSISSLVDSSYFSRIHQIRTTKKEDEPIIWIEWYNEKRDTVFSSNGTLLLIDSLDDNTVEYTRINKEGNLSQRERYINRLLTYSYSLDIETLISYSNKGLIKRFKIKPLTKVRFIKDYLFEYNERNELVKRVDMIKNKTETYSYFYQN